MRHEGRFEAGTSALLVVDMQEGNVAKVERGCEVVHGASVLLRGCRALAMPVFFCELATPRCGSTAKALLVGDGAATASSYSHTAYDSLTNEELAIALKDSGVVSVIVIGFEAHVSVLQTARGLLAQGYRVAVANDLVSSVTIFDYSTAIAELRDLGVRVSSSSTLLHELAYDCRSPLFNELAHETCCALPW